MRPLLALTGLWSVLSMFCAVAGVTVVLFTEPGGMGDVAWSVLMGMWLGFSILALGGLALDWYTERAKARRQDL